MGELVTIRGYHIKRFTSICRLLSFVRTDSRCARPVRDSLILTAPTRITAGLRHHDIPVQRIESRHNGLPRLFRHPDPLPARLLEVGAIPVQCPAGALRRIGPMKTKTSIHPRPAAAVKPAIEEFVSEEALGDVALAPRDDLRDPEGVKNARPPPIGGKLPGEVPAAFEKGVPVEIRRSGSPGSVRNRCPDRT